MRGTHQIFRHVRGKIGIIPAYAGNTEQIPHCVRHARDHPRVCGEHEGIAHDAKSGTGSSPRMRGTLRRTACA